MRAKYICRLAALFCLSALLIAISCDDVFTAQPQSEAVCDPIISGVASFIFPGWGQYLNGETGRKPLIHLSIGLGLTLALIYRWGTPDGDLARVGRLLWGVISGFEAVGTCYRRITPQPLSH